MKSKTINTILCKKFDEFVASIDDPKVKQLVQDNTIITGGSIVSLLLGDKVNDYDMYFRNKETVLAVSKYYVKKFKANPPSTFKDANKAVDIYVLDCDLDIKAQTGQEAVPIGPRVWFDDTQKQLEQGRIKIVIQSAGIAGAEATDDYQYFEGIANAAEQAEATASYVDAHVKATEDADEQPAAKVQKETHDARGKFAPDFLSSNAISLSGKVQLVVRFYGEPDVIHENYDFSHCTSYWTSWERKLTLRPDAMEAILSRELKYIGSKYPICSMIRTRKFLGRGWTINAGQYVKMAWQVSRLNLADVRVLEDQLVGVDAAYFMQVIALLRQQPDPEHLDGTYIMTVIDKLF